MSTESLTIRAMQARDVDAVCRNETRAYEYPWTRGMFEDCLAGAPYDCWVAERGGTVAGHGVLSVGAGEAHLLNVCVSRDLQGRGFGRQLVAHLVKRAATLGATAMFLEVRPTNARAIQLYHSFGFKEIGVRKGYYPASFGREDALVFGLDLERQPL